MAKKRKRQYGKGTIVPPSRPGGLWSIRWREGTKRLSRGGFTSPEMASKVLDAIQTDLVQGRTGIKADPRQLPTIEVLSVPFRATRRATHKSWGRDESRWKRHLLPFFGHMRPSDVTKGKVAEFVSLKRAEGLAAGSVGLCLQGLSMLFKELNDQEKFDGNPLAQKSEKTKHMLRINHDPALVPFIERLEDIGRIFQELYARKPKVAVGYAIGVLAGLRTGEVFGLEWPDVNLSARRIHVRRSMSESGELKTAGRGIRSRVVPIVDSLLPVLREWQIKTGGQGLVVPAPHCSTNNRSYAHFVAPKTLRLVLKKLGLERDGLSWYECTRHTFASQWVLGGGSVVKLKELLGHRSLKMTERYLHLRTDLFADKELGALPVDMSAHLAPVTPLRSHQ